MFLAFSASRVGRLLKNVLSVDKVVLRLRTMDGLLTPLEASRGHAPRRMRSTF